MNYIRRCKEYSILSKKIQEWKPRFFYSRFPGLLLHFPIDFFAAFHYSREQELCIQIPSCVK